MYKNIKDDPDYDQFGLVDMFTDLDYKEITYEFCGRQIKLFALQTAATDYDLTGQIVWEAARVFSEWIFTGDRGAELFGGKSVLELGSGPGLGAFVAANYAKRVCLTDY